MTKRKKEKRKKRVVLPEQQSKRNVVLVEDKQNQADALKSISACKYEKIRVSIGTLFL